MNRSLNILISVFILAFSVFIGGFLIHKYRLYPNSSIESTRAVRKPITLPDVNWSEQAKTLVLALQANCHFCNESAPFYKVLIETVKGKNIKLVAVLPTNIEESRAHLDKLGLNDLDVRQASLDSVQVDGTPTLLLFNDKGEVVNNWVGKLPTNKEADVIKNLISGR